MAEVGFLNPFFYHLIYTDFDETSGLNNIGTVTIPTAGDGGIATATTAAAAGSNAGLSTAGASFTLPLTGGSPPGSSTDTRKMIYMVRVQVAATTDSFICGWTSTTSPLSSGVNAETDGLFLYKPPTANTLQLINVASAANSPSGSAVSNIINLPASVVTAANTWITLVIYIDSYQNVKVWVGDPLVGYVPQSGTGPAGSNGVTIIPVLAPVLSNYNFVPGNTSPLGTPQTNPLIFTTANLYAIMVLSNGTTAAATTGLADFFLAAKER